LAPPHRCLQLFLIFVRLGFHFLNGHCPWPGGYLSGIEEYLEGLEMLVIRLCLGFPSLPSFLL
jgi:hypothetical protein